MNSKKQRWLREHLEIAHPRHDLSEEAIELLFQMSEQHVPHERIDWDTFFIGMAQQCVKRSPDAQTQVGAVIVSPQKHIMSTGYNGWMPGIDDELMPNVRPLKHLFARHAERNALLNCEVRPRGATLYCTHKPCTDCLQDCAVAGIAEVVYTNCSTTNTDGKDAEWEVIAFLLRDRMTIREL